MVLLGFIISLGCNHFSVSITSAHSVVVSNFFNIAVLSTENEPDEAEKLLDISSTYMWSDCHGHEYRCHRGKKPTNEFIFIKWRK